MASPTICPVPRRNVPGTHRKVALHDESFDGTPPYGLVRKRMVIAARRPVLYDTVTLSRFNRMEYLGMASKLKETMRNIRTSIVLGKIKHLMFESSVAMTSRSDLSLMMILLQAKTWIFELFLT